MNSTQEKILQQLKKPSVLRSLFLYIKIYSAIVLAMMLENQIAAAWLTFLVILFIAGRQHSLYILNHDASHGSLFQSKRINKIVATIFSTFVMFHHPEAWSFVQWRRIHLYHHRFLFSENDPNYVTRTRSGDTVRPYIGKEILFFCLCSIPETIRAFFFGKQDYVYPRTQFVVSKKHLATLLIPDKNDKEMIVEWISKIVFMGIIIGLINYFSLWREFFILWLLPMYSFYPMILKFHDLTEHHWHVNSKDIAINTHSIKRSFFTKLLLSFLPRNFHREHHLFPKVCVVNLTKLNKLLSC